MTQYKKTINALNAVGYRPYYEDGQVALYQGDCRVLLSHIPKGSIDLTVTSPPYNIGKEYEEISEISDFVIWCKEWMHQIYSATKNSGSFWLNLGYFEVPGKGKNVPISYLLWDQSPFYLLQEVVWHYGAGVAARKYLSPRNEKFLWYIADELDYTFNLDEIRDPNVKYPNQKKNGKLKCNPNGKNPSDVWQFPKVTSGFNRSSAERAPHPAQFPMAVIDRIMKACSNRGELILDPFMGSGTTVDVALRNERNCIGFELREDYLCYAVERIERTKLQMVEDSFQLKLFT